MKVSIVSYTNSKPFLFGLNEFREKLNIEISLDDPGQCAAKLKEGDVSIGLVPVVSIDGIPDAGIIGDYGIAASGEVLSVILASEVPIQSISRIYLDSESRTSAALLKILANEHWNINVEWVNAEPGYEFEIRGKTAGLIIGDRALELRDRYNYVYDLSLAWLEMTQKPFVFARWVSNVALEKSFIDAFDDALRYGVNSIDSLIASGDLNNDRISINVGNYLKTNIDYFLDEEMKAGMNLFLQKAKLLSTAPAV